MQAAEEGGAKYQYGYTNAGQLQYEKYIIGSTAATTSFSYNSGQQLTGVTLPNAAQLSYAYNSLGQRTASLVTSSNSAYGFKTELTYATGANGKATDRVEEISYRRVANNNETAAGGFRYTYDDVGNITEIADANDNCLVSYVYDELYQLVEEHDFVRGVDVYYTYDGAGNLLSKSTEDSWGPLGTQTYAYNDSVWGDLLTSFNNQSITYDTIGNPLSYRGWTMDWEAGRQLAGMTKGTPTLKNMLPKPA